MDTGNRCILCGNEKPGIAIREDSILGVYRKVVHAFRTVTGRGALNNRNYHLVVCRDDYQKYRKMRSSYVRKEVTYVGIGIVFTALMMIVSPSKLLALLYGLILIAFLFLLAQVSYMPALDIPQEGHAAEQANSTSGKARQRTAHRPGRKKGARK